MKIRKGDIVKVLSGKDRGKEGEVLRVFPREERVVVKGVNIVTRHKKDTGNQENPGGRIKTENPIHISNVMLVSPHSGKPTRVGFEIDPDTGKKVRISKKDNKPI